MSKQKWIDENGVFYPIPGNTVLHVTPGPGVWQVYQSPSPQDNRLGLVKLSDKFEFPGKVYNLGCESLKKRIRKVWESDIFQSGNKNLGVILNGVKGGGKSWFAKVMCNEYDLPVVIVDSSFDGAILGFIQSLTFECIVLIDEAEKTFKKGEEDEILLKLIDGIYNESRKLYILTTNTLDVNPNLLGRPGRIRYIQEFKNLPTSVIEEYIKDNLIDQTKRDKVIAKVDLLEISTIDILKCIIDEVNILGDLPDSDNEIDPMNIPMAKHVFEVLTFYGCSWDDVESIKKIIKEKKPIECSLKDWLGGVWRKAESPDEADYTNADRFDDEIVSCNYTSTQRCTTSFSKLWVDCETSIGHITREPDDYGFFTTTYGDGREYLHLVIRQRENPSLYRGGLAF